MARRKYFEQTKYTKCKIAKMLCLWQNLYEVNMNNTNIKINVKINGKDVELENCSTVQDLINERNITGTMFVVEKNLEIVPKENYTQTKVEENDIFEIVGFFGGG